MRIVLLTFMLIINSPVYSQDSTDLPRKAEPYYFWLSAAVPFTGGYFNKYTDALGPSLDAQMSWKNNLVTVHHTFGGTIAAPDEINAWLFLYGRHYTKGFFYANASLGYAFVKGDYENDQEDMVKYDYQGFAYRIGAGVNLLKFIGVGAYYTGVKSRAGTDHLLYWLVINIGKLK